MPIFRFFLWFKLVFVPSKAFGIIWVIVDSILLKNRNFCAQKNNFHKSQKRHFALNYLDKIDIQISHVILIVLEFFEL